MMKFRIALLGMILVLAGCDTTSAVLWSTQDLVQRIFHSPDVNLVEKSTAAADYIQPQIKTYIKRTDLITTAPLTLVHESAATSEFGRLIPIQIAERLRQLGYTVAVPDEVNNTPMPPGDFVIGGTYDKNSRDTYVNLRIIDTKTGQVISSFNYNMPTTSEINKLGAPEARIYKLKQ